MFIVLYSTPGSTTLQAEKRVYKDRSDAERYADGSATVSKGTRAWIIHIEDPRLP